MDVRVAEIVVPAIAPAVIHRLDGRPHRDGERDLPSPRDAVRERVAAARVHVCSRLLGHT